MLEKAQFDTDGLLAQNEINQPPGSDFIMRAAIFMVSVSMLLAGCSQSVPPQNHLGLVAAPDNVSVDSRRASDPAPITSVTKHRWKRTSLQRKAEAVTIQRGQPYSSLR